MTYDSFGNRKTIAVGTRTLMHNTYASKNGQLTQQTYGNGDTVSFTYDSLGRILQTDYSDGRTLDYTYNGNGQLHTVKDRSTGVVYAYTYDMLDRLISSQQSGPNTNIRNQYVYDTNNRLTRWYYAAPGLSTVYETFTYNTSTTDSISDGALTSMRLLTGDSMTFGYDTLSRLKTRKIANQVLETYTYTPGTGSSTTTTLVAEKKNQVNGSTVHNFKYQYDARGNLSKVTDAAANTSVAYTYDSQGQLLKAVHKKGTATQRTETYSYDTYGNIRSYSNGTNSHSYTYGDTNGWKDLLTKVDGHSLSYDGSGNPLSYYNGKSYTMAWSEGRNLTSLTTGGKTATYTYDMNGLRTKKTNLDGTWVKYFVGDGKILGETLYGTDNVWVYDMRYTFDENGDVCGISLWNRGDTAWTKYYFVKNLQGDVLAVYQYGSSFTKVAEYTYDSWGNVLTATGALANINPFRYRSYYRDADTGFYYLQSRYYDPAIGRFINADSFTSTGQDFLGCNMFAYCGNNPVNFCDHLGYMAGNPCFMSICDGGSSRMHSLSKDDEDPNYKFIIRNGKKGGDGFKKRKDDRRGSDLRKPSGARERNVGHPDGEEHSRVPKGNRGIHRFEGTITDSAVTLIPRYYEPTLWERIGGGAQILLGGMAIVVLCIDDSSGVGVADDAFIPSILKYILEGMMTFGG